MALNRSCGCVTALDAKVRDVPLALSLGTTDKSWLHLPYSLHWVFSHLEPALLQAEPSQLPASPPSTDSPG